MLLDEDLIKLDLLEEEDRFKENISSLRTGTPSINAFNEVYIDYFGASSPIKHLASYSQSGLTITFKVFDQSNTAKLVEAINNKQVGGFAKVADASTIIVNFVAMTGEVRQGEIKKLNSMLEDARIAVRQKVRRKYMEEISAMEKVPEDEQKRSEERVQELVDKSIESLENISREKQKEIEAV
mgnify:CR=1 FL=1